MSDVPPLNNRERVIASLIAHMPTCPNLGCPKGAGPLYCHPCSAAISDWVQWTPEHAAEHVLAALDPAGYIRDALAPIQALLARAEQGADVWGTCQGEWLRIEELRAALAAALPSERTDG